MAISYPPFAMLFNCFASFSISSVFLYTRTESTFVVVVFCSSSRSSPDNW